MKFDWQVALMEVLDRNQNRATIENLFWMKINHIMHII